MGKTEYKFCELNVSPGESYYVQVTNRRKLSDIYHSHDFYEILCVLEGECTHLENGKRYRMKRGDSCWIEPGREHSFLKQTADTSILGLSVRPEEFLRFLQVYAQDETELFKRERLFRIPVDRLPFLLPERRDETAFRHLLSDFIYHMLGQAEVYGEKIPKRLAEALQKMQELSNARDGAEALLRLSEYSPTHLQRLMQKHLGVSVHTYILELRMRLAYQLLVSGGLCIEDVAESVGYRSMSHFCQIFKKYFGITPAALAKSGVRTI